MKRANLTTLTVEATGRRRQPSAQKNTSVTIFIGGQFSRDVRNALKLAEGYSGKNLKSLLSEAINHICAKYGAPQPCTEE